AEPVEWLHRWAVVRQRYAKIDRVSNWSGRASGERYVARGGQITSRASCQETWSFERRWAGPRPSPRRGFTVRKLNACAASTATAWLCCRTTMGHSIEANPSHPATRLRVV